MAKIESYTEKTTLADTDVFVLADSEALDAESDLTTKKVVRRNIGPTLNPRTTFFIKDDFGPGAGTALNIGELPWSSVGGTITNLAAEVDRPGLLRRDTSATSGVNAYISLRNASATILLPVELFDMTFILRLNTNDAATLVRFGIVDNAGTNPPTHGIFIEKLAADTQWFGVTRAASVQTRTAALATVDTAWHRFRIRRVNGTTIGFTLDAGTELTLTATIPTAALNVYLAIINSAAAAKTIDIDYFELTITGLTR